MRKSIAQALKWYKESKSIKLMKQGDQKKSDEKGAKKVVEIQIGRAEGLKIVGKGAPIDTRGMSPFLSYDFYTFEFRSHNVQGANANFDCCRRYEVEANQQFYRYMKNSVLTIDLIDESVDMKVPGARDYIGSCRVSLREVYEQGSIHNMFIVEDENRTQTGHLEVKIRMIDTQMMT